MLFKKQYQQVVNEAVGEKLFFYGTTRVPMESGEKFVRVVGIKQPDGKIRTEVTYHFPLHDGMVTEKPFDKELDPVTFEKFLNDLAMTISKAEPQNKLVDLPLAYLCMPDIDQLTEEQAWLLDLMFMAVSGSYEETRTGYVHVRDIIKDVESGQRDPKTLKPMIIQAIEELQTQIN